MQLSPVFPIRYSTVYFQPFIDLKCTKKITIRFKFKDKVHSQIPKLKSKAKVPIVKESVLTLNSNNNRILLEKKSDPYQDDYFVICRPTP